MDNKIPKSYYSFHTDEDGKIRWSLISQGMSLCAEKDNKDEAEKVAIHLLKTKILPIWNGDKGIFENG